MRFATYLTDKLIIVTTDHDVSTVCVHFRPVLHATMQQESKSLSSVQKAIFHLRSHVYFSL